MKLTGGRRLAANAAVVVVTLLLVTSPVAGFLLPVDGGDALSSVPTQPPATVDVDEALENASGETELIVVMEETSPPVGVDRADAVDSLKRQATSSQVPMERYAASKSAVTIQRQFWITNAVLVTVDTDEVPVEALARIEGVRAIEENDRVTVPESVSTTTQSVNESGPQGTDTTYGLDQINATEAWNTYDTRGEGVRVAVLDTGVNDSHPDIELANTEDWAQFDDDGNRVYTEPNDGHGHGTHTSGTVAGGDASGKHIGVAPDATLMHGKVLTEHSDGWYGSGSQVLGGMEWAVDNDADVVSMSLGSQSYHTYYLDAVQNTESSGAVVVASAGNSEEGNSSNPGNLYDTIAVGASDSSANIASFSSGEVVDVSVDYSGYSVPPYWPAEFVVPSVSAPGVSVYSSMDPETGNGEYASWQGTSMAAPHVAGTVALMKSANGNTGPAETKSALRETAWKPAGEPEDTDTRYGDGIVDAHAAVGAVANGSATGTVTYNHTGDPLPNATVTFADAESGETTVSVETDAEGVYEAPEVPPKTYEVTASKDGYTPVTREIEVTSTTVTEADFSLDGTGAVDGNVTAFASGDPMENVTVEFADVESVETVLSVETDANGVYGAPEVPVGEYDVRAREDGYHVAPTRVSVAAGENVTGVDFTMVQNGSVAGTVLDAGTDEAVENATVVAAADGREHAATTDGNGTYHVTDVPGETEYDVRVEAEGYYDATTAVQVADGQDVTGVDFALDAEPGSVEGTVADAYTADGIENATVTVTDDAGTVVETLSTGADGSYAVPVERGTYTVETSADDYVGTASSTVTVDPGENVTDADFELTGQNGSIEGRVLDDWTNETLANATVTLVDAQTGETLATVEGDENGVYRVADAPRAVYEVTADRDRYHTGTAIHEVGPNETVTDANVSLEGEDGTVAGTVTNASGAPVPSATVTIVGVDQNAVALASTDENGTYAMDMQRGTYEVTADKRAFRPDNRTVTIEPAENVTGVDIGIERRAVYFAPSDMNAPADVDRGSELTATANVTNLGTDNATLPVAYWFDGTNETRATENVTLSSGETTQVEFTHGVSSDRSPDVYRHGITGNETLAANVTVEKPSSGGGGGGGGGGVGPPSILTEVTVLENGDAAIDLVNGRPGPVSRTMLPDVGTDAVTFTQFDVRLSAENAKHRYVLRPRTEPPSAVPALDASPAIGYLTVDKEGITDSEIAELTFTFEVDADALPADAAPGDVVLYHYDGDEWEPLDTDRRGSDYAASADGASTFAVGLAPDDDGGADEETPTATDDGPPRTETDAPGFGPVVVLVSLLAAALLAARRHR